MRRCTVKVLPLACEAPGAEAVVGNVRVVSVAVAAMGSKGARPFADRATLRALQMLSRRLRGLLLSAVLGNGERLGLLDHPLPGVAMLAGPRRPALSVALEGLRQVLMSSMERFAQPRKIGT